jgi:hypothetical protein
LEKNSFSDLQSTVAYYSLSTPPGPFTLFAMAVIFGGTALKRYID